MGTPAAISAAVLAVLLWLFSRRRAALPAQQAQANRLAQPQTVPTLVQPLTAAAPSATQASLAIEGPGGGVLQSSLPALPRARRPRLQLLSSQLNGSLLQRLAAVAHLANWGDRAVVPLLMRALRDPHPEVAVAAAAAMARFRGRSAAAPPVDGLSAPAGRRPRNAAPRLQSA